MFDDNDIPISSPVEDDLGNRQFAFYLAKGIMGLDKINQSYVIGLIGNWGEGKTSIINMTLKYIEVLEKHSDYEIEDLDEIIKKEKNENKKASNNPKKGLSLFVYIVILAFIFYYIYLLIQNFLLNVDISNNLKTLFLCFSIVSILYFTIEKISLSSLMYLSKKVEIENIFKIIKNYIHPKDFSNYITIKFSPWDYSNQEKIMENFFNCIIKKINSYNDNYFLNLAIVIKQYSKLILNLDLSFIDKIFLNKNVGDIKEKINNCLKNCENKKIIVIIDDIDRLCPKEILTILKTIKTIADFPNVIYLLSFDKETLVDLLESKYNFKADEYLKKIIQIEKTIPHIDFDILKSNFKEKMEKALLLKDKSDLDLIETLYEYSIGDIYIKNLRDLYKFFNTFKFIYTSYKKENINICDLIAITAIEVFEPKLYSYIKNNKEILCSTQISSDNPLEGSIYSSTKLNSKLIEEFIKELSAFSNIKILSVLFSPLFNKLYSSITRYKLNHKENLPNEIQNFINKIDIETLYQFNANENYRRINDISCFDNYFRTNFNDKTINLDDYNDLISSLPYKTTFASKFKNIYKKNPNKIIDFFNGWNSSYNRKNRTKKNTINLFKNLFSLDVLDFINYSSNLYNILNCFNIENKKDEITADDILDIIKESIKYLNKNCYLFINTIIHIENEFKRNLVELTDANKLEEYKELICKNITNKGIINSKKGFQCIYYLINNFKYDDFVLSLIDEILKDDKKLLNLLMTGFGIAPNYISSFGYVREFFKKYNKTDEIKNKLLNILNSKENLMHDKRYIININSLEYDNQHIVNIILDTLSSQYI